MSIKVVVLIIFDSQIFDQTYPILITNYIAIKLLAEILAPVVEVAVAVELEVVAFWCWVQEKQGLILFLNKRTFKF